MAYDKKFTYTEYGKLVGSLDEALAVFEATTPTKETAEAALQDFITNHYFKVWRAWPLSA